MPLEQFVLPTTPLFMRLFRTSSMKQPPRVIRSTASMPSVQMPAKISSSTSRLGTSQGLSLPRSCLPAVLLSRQNNSNPTSDSSPEGPSLPLVWILTRPPERNYKGCLISEIKYDTSYLSLLLLVNILQVDTILAHREVGLFADRADYEARTGLHNTLKRKHSDFLYFTH